MTACPNCKAQIPAGSQFLQQLRSKNGDGDGVRNATMPFSPERNSVIIAAQR